MKECRVHLQINPQIYLWKEDESVRMTGFTSHNPRVETRGYFDLINDVIQCNPQIHLWDQNVSKSPETIFF
ncbi:MAG: hypothetical protein COT43_05620 [Candidatus Marinimicrobia bacterium CG08_land_8_20_14_0_20_45_22]|nr:MAG: hypothetical protein COT43_05620 [Candidatus Marinimicrobia bacterium CG08_land_8_20_14_0_20_45_22]